jgi:zinc/manganese transport system ATP-binding protein
MSVRIELDDISVSLGGQPVLDRVSFVIEPGEFIGIIGPNGAGKSTLLRVILGNISADSGQVKIMATDGSPAPRHAIGYMPQTRLIDPELPISATDFVGFGLPHRYRPWLNRADRGRVSELLGLVGAAHLAGKPIGRLSGGERQRVCLAQALAGDPKALLLDEPTASLDPAMQEQIADLIGGICREKVISVLFISHDVELVEERADRMLYMGEGEYSLKVHRTRQLAGGS